MNPLEVLSLDRLRTRTSLKWRAYPPDVLPLWVAEMDVELAEPVVAAVCDAMRAGDTGYPDGGGYADAYAAFARERWRWPGVDPGRSVLVADVMTGVAETVKLITRPGDAVVVNCPVYPPFYGFLAAVERRVVEAPLTEDCRLDLDGLQRAFADGAAAYLLCNPHNPTGTVHTVPELVAVAELADRYGVRVVVDEIHSPLVLDGAAFTPYLSVPGAESAFGVFSASKAWNLAGLKSALILAGPDAGADLARLPEVVTHGPSHLGVISHVAALRAGGAWLDDLLAGLGRNRALLVELVHDRLPGVRMPRPEATFLAWLDFGDRLPVGSGDRGDMQVLSGPAAYLLEHARVALSPGSAFGGGGATCARLNFATSEAVLTEAIERIAAALPS